MKSSFGRDIPVLSMQRFYRMRFDRLLAYAIPKNCVQRLTVFRLLYFFCFYIVLECKNHPPLLYNNNPIAITAINPKNLSFIPNFRNSPLNNATPIIVTTNQSIV